MAYKFFIGTQSDTSGIDKVTGALKKADDAADDFIASIKAGVGIDIGGKIVNSIAAIPGMLQSAISKGMEFNATMNNAEVGIANVLGKFMNLDAQAAKAEAAKAIQKIIELEPKAAGGLSDLVGGFMSTVAAAQGLGISVQDNIDLVGKFANALANSSQPIQQLGQEMRSILTGNITADSAIAKTLEISNADIAKAKEAGNVVEFLTQKLGKLGEAGDSAAVRMSSFDSAVEQALGKFTQPIFDAWIEGLTDLTDAAGENGGAEAMEILGHQIAILVKSGASFTQMLTQHSGLIIGVGKAVGVLAAAWGAYQIAALIVGLNRKAAAIFSNKAALDAETASLAKNTAGQAANNTTRAAGSAAGGLAGKVKNSWAQSNVAGTAGTTLGVGLIGYNLVTGWAAEINAASDGTKKLVTEVANIANGYNNAIKSASSLAEKQDIIKGLEADIKKLRESAGEASERDAELMERTANILERQLGTARKLSDETLRQKEAATAQATAEKERDEKIAENQKIIDADIARRRDAARDRTARNKLDEASALMEKGDVSGAKGSLDDQERYFKDWRDQAAAKIDPGTQDKETLKEGYDLVQKIEGYLESIKDARKQLPKAIEEADKKAREEQVKTLEEQKDLAEAEGKKRLAELDAQGKKGEENAKARLAIEDEIARTRLDFENQIGALQKESDLARQTREITASADRISRHNAAKDTSAADNLASGQYDAGEGRIATGTGTSKKYGIKGASYDIYGNLTGGTRGGAPISATDMASINSAEGGGMSSLDRYKNSQPGMPGYTPTVPGSTVPPIAQPAAPVTGAGPQAPGAADSSDGKGGESEGISKSIDSLTKKIASFEKQVITGLDKIGAGTDSFGGKAVGKLSDHEQRLKALESKI